MNRHYAGRGKEVICIEISGEHLNSFCAFYALPEPIAAMHQPALLWGWGSLLAYVSTSKCSAEALLEDRRELRSS